MHTWEISDHGDLIDQGTGLGVTKPFSSIPLFSGLFTIIEALITCWISHSYLTGVIAAQLRWQPVKYGSDSRDLTGIFSCDQAAPWMVFSVRPSVCLSVCPSHLFHYVPLIESSWKFQELLPMTEVMSMQKVKVRGQRSRSQRSWPHLAVSGP